MTNDDTPPEVTIWKHPKLGDRVRLINNAFTAERERQRMVPTYGVLIRLVSKVRGKVRPYRVLRDDGRSISVHRTEFIIVDRVSQ